MLENNGRAAVCQQLLCTAQYGRLGALHIQLDNVRWRQLQAVQRDLLDGFLPPIAGGLDDPGKA